MLRLEDVVFRIPIGTDCEAFSTFKYFEGTELKIDLSSISAYQANIRPIRLQQIFSHEA